MFPSCKPGPRGFSDSTVPISIDSLVWLVDSSSPKGQYALGRVVKLNIIDDGNARLAINKTFNGLFARPLVKLVPLPSLFDS